MFLLKRKQTIVQSTDYERTFKIRESRTVLEYYKKRLDNSVKPSDLYHNLEIVGNYPTLRYMLECLGECRLNYSLSQKMEYIYDRVKNRSPKMPSGIIADLIACLIYLMASCKRTSKVSE